MGLFSRKPKFRVEVVGEPPRPGERLRGEVVATRLRAGQRITIAYATVAMDGRRQVDPSTWSSSDAPPATEERWEARILQDEVLHDVELVPEEMRIPFEVQLPVWMPPTAIGEVRVLPSPGPKVTIGPLYGDARFEVAPLPVHYALLDGIAALGCQVRGGKLWERSDFGKGKRRGKRTFDHRIECSPPAELEHSEVKVTAVVVVPTATSRETATTDVLVLARKLGRGAFVLAKVTDIELAADPAGWARAVKEQLQAALAGADISGQASADGGGGGGSAAIIDAVLQAWLR
ncbi:hypothetical protein F0U44_10200 [Nocardioides humilatus]|uniref:Sporulation-control protein spo0M n=1 Tax=Nocardioides humilatus TaxID=2607660 RepID=A0A5B1LEG3_9ACTN|nr:hypothetical protein [Nocardioides humilatus]KAA1418846.1 hypothetical protein F0U44_10200 [Nocardioides humilatus]